VFVFQVGRHKAFSAGGIKLIVSLLSRLDRMETFSNSVANAQASVMFAGSYSEQAQVIHKQTLCLLLCGLISSLAHKSGDLQSKLGVAGVTKHVSQFVEDYLSVYWTNKAQGLGAGIVVLGPAPPSRGRQMVSAGGRAMGMAGLMAARAFSAVVGGQTGGGDNDQLSRLNNSSPGARPTSPPAVEGVPVTPSDELDVDSIGEIGWLGMTNICLEALRAVGCLSAQNEGNRGKFVNGPVADVLAQFLNDVPTYASSSQQSGLSADDLALKHLASVVVDVLVGGQNSSIPPQTPSPTQRAPGSSFSSSQNSPEVDTPSSELASSVEDRA
jgi:hypothetical protein